MSPTVSEEDVFKRLSAIEAALGAALRSLGHVELPTHRGAWNDVIRVTNPSGSKLDVLVREERTKSRLMSRANLTGKFMVRVEGVVGLNRAFKRRSRDFVGLPEKMTPKQISDIVAVVALHLTTQDQVNAQYRAREVEKVRALQVLEHNVEQLKEICDEMDLERPDNEGESLTGRICVQTFEAGFRVTLDSLSEDHLREVIRLWKVMTTKV